MNHKNTCFLKKIARLKKIKKEICPDITISTLVSVNTLNVLSCGRDIKIGVFHSPLEQTKNVNYLNYLLCSISYRLFFRKLDYLYAVSETTKKDVERHTGCKVKLVYNIHNFDEINCKSKEPLTDEENKIFSKKVILYVGHLYDSKGVRRLIKSFARIKTDANLVLIGGDANGNIPDYYKIFTKDSGICDRIFFLGHKDNPYKYMRHCSTLCLPSYSEGLPGVLIEALSLNKKIITTNSSLGVWEIMQCLESYSERLVKPFENELGFITSNCDDNDECVNQLVFAFERILHEENDNQLPFNKSRFEAKTLSKHFTLQ